MSGAHIDASFDHLEAHLDELFRQSQLDLAADLARFERRLTLNLGVIALASLAIVAILAAVC